MTQTQHQFNQSRVLKLSKFSDYLMKFTLILAFGVIVLGAYVRLSDAGLGCPDWPFCYGHIGVPQTEQEKLNALNNYSTEIQASTLYKAPIIETAKAWKEMIHRYLASTVGLFILINFLCQLWLYRQKKNTVHSFIQKKQVFFSLGLLLMVCLQGAFGAWTVTLNLYPAIVTGHLVGGMILLSLLVVWNHGNNNSSSNNTSLTFCPKLLKLTKYTLMFVAIQIILGGWVSTNYALGGCGLNSIPNAFPLCQGSFYPAEKLNFLQGFNLFHELHLTSDNTPISQEALTAIHYVHRIGAIIVLILTTLLSFMLFKKHKNNNSSSNIKFYAIALITLVLIQWGIGASLIIKNNLHSAVIHNAVAALLLGVMIKIRCLVGQKR